MQFVNSDMVMPHALSEYGVDDCLNMISGAFMNRKFMQHPAIKDHCTLLIKAAKQRLHELGVEIDPAIQ